MVFGVLFGLTSSLGFVRWPFLMQYLGELLHYASPGQIENIRVIYDSFHIYAGVSVGENFAFWFEFLWTFLFSTSLLSKREFFPAYMARIGQALGIGMLIYSLEQFGGFLFITRSAEHGCSYGSARMASRHQFLPSQYIHTLTGKALRYPDCCCLRPVPGIGLLFLYLNIT